MTWITAQHPFVIPSAIPPTKQLDYCIGIINRYRRELPALRMQSTKLKDYTGHLEEQVDYWQKQYKEKVKEIEKLKKEKEKLKREIEKLTKTNSRYQVAVFDHGNFKHPEKKDEKPKGGQTGHADTNREASVDYRNWKHERLFVHSCGQCGNGLSRVSAIRQKILIDIVINPEVVQLILDSERQWCGHCKMEVTARDGRSLPFTEYGISTFLLVLILRLKAHASLSSIASVLSISHGLTLSASEISNLLKQAKQYLRGRYDKLIAAVRNGSVIYADETGWLVNGQKAWLWIMATEEATVYYAAESRGKGIAEEMYGNSQSRVMHDGLASYGKAIPKNKHCLCWSHMLRFAHEETIKQGKRSKAIFLKDELVRVYHIKKDHSEYPPKQLEHILREEIDRLLSIKSKNRSCLAIQVRLKTQKEGLINSLLHTKDGTNNFAERELRPMVIKRHISNGSNTYAGMETTAIIGSIIQTAGRRKENLLPQLTAYLQEGIKDMHKQYVHIPQHATA